ncbi:MAG: DNA primase [Rhodoluna sp.]|nr:DNA primase [Rhodoluna sp.]
MAKRIPQSDIDEVLSRVSIVDVVGDYVALKAAGNGEFKGLCPFHGEKSPSFGVSATKNLWHCFGCGEGGNLFQFLNRIDSLNFVEAVEKLATRVGYTLNYEEGGETNPNHAIRARVLEANSFAAKFFAERLADAEAEPGRQFLQGRGFDQAAATHFGVGWAPKGWSALTDHLKTLGFSEDELVTAALASKKEKGAYDRFRGRLIWPIRDSTNAVIGFGARKISEDDQGPKYLNTSETPVYHKSSVLYGIDLAKREISKTQRVVVVEGYTDVMACHLAGITTAVATCGTAFGDDHIKILNRILVADAAKPAEVIFNFDPDEAGQKAAMRAFASAQKFNALTFIAIGPEGLDPCDLRKERGDSAIVDMIATKRPLIEFAIERSISKFDLASREGQVAAVRAAVPILVEIQDAHIRSSYEKHLSELTLVDRAMVNQLVTEAARGVRRETVIPRQENIVQADEVNGLPPVNLNDPINRRERWLLEVVAQVPSALDEPTMTRIFRSFFSAPRHAALAKVIAPLYGKPGFVELVSSELPIDLASLWREIILTTLPVMEKGDREAYATGVVRSSLSATIEFEKQLLIQTLMQSNAAKNESQSEQIARKLVELDAELIALRAKR